MRAVDLIAMIMDCDALRDVTSAHGNVLSTAEIGTWQVDLQTSLARRDDVAARIMGMQACPDEAPMIAPVHLEDRAAVVESLERSFATGSLHDVVFRPLDTDGEVRWVREIGRPQPSGNGWSRWMRGIAIDVTDRKAAELALEESEQRFAALTSNLPGMAYRCLADDLWDMRFASAGALDISGWPAEEICASASGWTNLIHLDDVAQARQRAETAIAAGKPFLLRYRIISRDGEVKWVQERGQASPAGAGGPSYVDGFIWDVTDQESGSDKLQYAATHDGLTRVPNRSLFHQRLQEALERASLSASSVGVLLLDLDDFKLVNNSFGHMVGDSLLCAVADRLGRTLGSDDVIARLSSDEFGVIVAGGADRSSIQRLATKMLASFEEPFAHQGRLFRCRASIGVSLYPEDGKRRSDLLKNADIALGAAKMEGGAKLVFFDRSMRTNRQDSAAMLSMARDAVINDWIIPYYQPKISLVTGRIEGFEALLRWHHPYDGIQGPGPIAAAFDDLELAASIGDRMTALVLADMWRWTREGVDFGHVSINASAAEFRHGDYGETLVARLKKAAIEPKRMQVEVAESVFLNRGADYISNALAHLSASGIAVSLDNFGTGNASLAQLRQIPVHSIKIDPSFVHGLVDDASDQTVVRALLSFCHDIGIHTTAKGVETRAQEEYLRHFGCDTGQGFLFAKAACASEVPALLASFGSRSPAAPGLIERREGPIRPWRGRRQAGRRAAV